MHAVRYQWDTRDRSALGRCSELISFREARETLKYEIENFFYMLIHLFINSVLSHVLLTSDKAAANFSDRSLLKNLGHWLGMITLAKNKPILHTVSFKMDICFELGYKKCFNCHWDFMSLTMFEFLFLCSWSLRLF